MNWQSPTLRAGGGRQAGRCCPAVGHSLSHGVTGTIAAQSHRGIPGTSAKGRHCAARRAFSSLEVQIMGWA